MPPTEDFDRFEWQSMLDKTLKEQGVIPKTIDESVAHIKQLCGLLEAAGVAEVFGEYDGSGDSGDMTITFYFDKKKTLPGNRPQPEAQREQVSEKVCRERLTAGDKPLVDTKTFDSFVDSLWAVLPRGWEINDGAYGEVTVDVESRKITVDHNERYTDVNSSNHTY